MKLIEALDLQIRKETVISFVGGGGKTSSLFALAFELAEAGKKVLITTTTAMYPREDVNHPCITILGDHINPEGKLKGILKESIDEFWGQKCYDFILVEADGSRGRPIKAPAEHEPVVPMSTGIYIGVIGIDSIGKPLVSEYVHRPELLAERTGVGLEDHVSESVLLKLISEPLGLFKNCPPQAQKVLLLNKILEEDTKEIGRRIGYQVLETCLEVERVLLGAVQEEEPVKELLLR